MGQSDSIKIRHINYLLAIIGICLVADAAAELHDLHFLLLNMVAAIAGYLTGPRWLDGDQQLTMDRALRVFWAPIAMIVILSLVLIAGPQYLEGLKYLFIAQAVLIGRRLKSHGPRFDGGK